MNLTAPTVVDLQAFDQLRRDAAQDEKATLAEAAVQFEALVIGMMLKSARDASLGSGLFDSSQTQQYLELMDQQVALDLARSGGFGFGRMIVEQLSEQPPAADARPARADSVRAPQWLTQDRVAALGPRSPFRGADAVRGLEQARDGASARPVAAGRAEADHSPIGSRRRFIERFLPDAVEAGRELGVEPRLLLAQAALETGWGRSIPHYPDGRPANNLFGIKAGASWRGPRIARWTIEHAGGVAERRLEQFRAYPSSADSFADYVALIGASARYAEAAAQARDPERYARAVARAGYATDPAYADKWLAIYNHHLSGDHLSGDPPSGDQRSGDGVSR
jgi:flagellar protein FlgJ